MKLRVGFKVSVTASTPDEDRDVERLNAKIAELGLNSGRRSRSAKLDESLSKDFNRILCDLAQLLNRADARRSRRK